MEEFFKDTRLFELFIRYAEIIKEEGYITCEKRRDNRTDCHNKSGFSHITSVDSSIVDGHSVVTSNIVTTYVDETRTETMCDEPEESVSGSIYSEGEDDFEDEEQEEEQSKGVKKRRQGPIDIKTLSND